MKKFGGWTRHVTEASRAGTYLICGPGVAREPQGQIPQKLRDRPHGAPWLQGSHGGQGLHTWGTGPMEPHGSVAVMVARAGHRWGVARVEHAAESGPHEADRGSNDLLCLTTAFLRVSLPGTYRHTSADVSWCKMEVVLLLPENLKWLHLCLLSQGNRTYTFTPSVSTTVRCTPTSNSESVGQF